MIRDKIFVKFAIVFGIGVLLFGSIIFFVNRNPKNEKHLNKVHKSVDAESTPVSDGPIKQTSAGFYLYDKAEQRIIRNIIRIINHNHSKLIIFSVKTFCRKFNVQLFRRIWVQ